MSVDFVCDQNEDIKDQIPSKLTEIKYEELSVNLDTNSIYVQGKVFTKCPLHRTKQRSQMKLLLQQDGRDEKLPVFLIGRCAEDCQQIAVGDMVAFSGFNTEASTRQQEGELPWQLTVESDKPDTKIWVRHLKGSSSAVSGTGVTGSSTSASSEMVTLTKPSTVRSYSYTLLKDVKPGITLNVYGVVKYFRPPTKTRGSDYSMLLSIVDDSSVDKLKCLLFLKRLEDFPMIENVGDIVRFHRLKVTSFREEPQGQMIKGSSCLVFSGDVGSSLTPRSQSATYTLTQEDLDRVCALREWQANDDNNILSQDEPTTALSGTSSGNRKEICDLEKCQVGQYFNLVCQVVARCVLVPGEAVLLQVWDGTAPSFPVKEVDLTQYDQLGELVADDELQAQAGDLVVDIQVFDNHAEKAATVMPGDYIRLTNLHAIQYASRPPDFACPLVVPAELDLHGGGAAYGRNLETLGHSDPMVTKLQERIVAIVGRQSNSPQRPDTSAAGEDITSGGSLQGDPAHATGSCDVDLAPLTTVLTAHHNQPIRALKQVVRHHVPYKFRIQCHFSDYMPRPQTAEDLVRVCCKTCQYIGSIPSSSKKPMPDDPVYVCTENGLRHFSCPLCPSNGNSKSILDYTMVLQFHLEDSSGWVVAGLWKSNAETFFHGTTAIDVLQDPATFQQIRENLQRLCSVKSDSSLSDICLKSYTTRAGVCYQIFDTCLAWSDEGT